MSVDEELRVCELIRKLMEDGVTVADAKRRAAMKYTVSIWTVGKIWRVHSNRQVR